MSDMSSDTARIESGFDGKMQSFRLDEDVKHFFEDFRGIVYTMLEVSRAHAARHTQIGEFFLIMNSVSKGRVTTVAGPRLGLQWSPVSWSRHPPAVWSSSHLVGGRDDALVNIDGREI